MSKIPYEEIYKNFEDKGYTLITTKDEYIGVTQKVKYICNKHKDKGIMEILPSKVRYGQGCYYCGREKTENAHLVELNIDEAKELCDKHDFTFVDIKRDEGLIYIYFICNKHSELGVQRMRKGNIKRDIKGCKYCGGKELPKWYVQDMIHKISPHIHIYGDYKNLSTKVEFFCEKHNEHFTNIPQNVIRGSQCYHCGLEKLANHQILTQDEYEEAIYKINPHLKVGKYNGMKNTIEVECVKCGYKWVMRADSLRANGALCRKCSPYYKGEDAVIKVLDSLNINHIDQYKFSDCIDKRPLPFDFYLPKYNCCIEFDGRQHYENVFGEESFRNIVKHDDIKNNYCKENGIKLIRIPYWDSGNIQQIITNKLNI